MEERRLQTEKKDCRKHLWGSAARKNLQKHQKNQKEPIHEYRPQTKPKNTPGTENRNERKEKGPTTQQKYAKETPLRNTLAMHVSNSNHLAGKQVFLIKVYKRGALRGGKRRKGKTNKRLPDPPTKEKRANEIEIGARAE